MEVVKRLGWGNTKTKQRIFSFFGKQQPKTVRQKAAIRLNCANLILMKMNYNEPFLLETEHNVGLGRLIIL
ncbi:hypothetical protein [Flagellimonas allohymeniacidonis]|uniref:Uncharacterized protein n=1 Tax=Flagellimonas allohymeniacidonis TaxID=2517819 RepID=A0A4Q8QEW7_9FLAO|nr:hypothetical protein [Allomuricauda hymeniacidonis]TAI49001.1 hypothetical protein EW142_04185 [Allomuricauda hymeniacidonis]